MPSLRETWKEEEEGDKGDSQEIEAGNQANSHIEPVAPKAKVPLLAKDTHDEGLSLKGFLKRKVWYKASIRVYSNIRHYKHVRY